MTRQSKRSGLFNGHWELVHDEDGRRKNVRIQRDEYPELYRLHRVCVETERGAAEAAPYALRGSTPRRSSSTEAGRTVGSLREHPSYGEANPFHV